MSMSDLLALMTLVDVFLRAVTHFVELLQMIGWL